LNAGKGRRTPARVATAVALAALAVGATFLRGAHAVDLERHDVLARFPQGDEATFAETARRVARREDDAVPYQAPLYPTLLGGLERIVGKDCFGTARVLQALLGLAAAGLAAELARRATGERKAAVVAFALVAFAKPLLHAEGTLLREAPSAALLAALVLAYARVQDAREPSLEPHAALGLALGLGLALRENFTIVAAAVGLERALGLARAARAAGRARAAAAAAVGLALGAALPLLPFDVKNARLGDGVHALPHWNSGCVFFLANRRGNSAITGYEPPPFVARGNPEAEQVGFRAEAERRSGRTLTPHAVGAFWLGEGVREILAAPGTFARRVGLRFVATLLPWETAHQRDPDIDARDSWVLRAPLPGAGALLVLAALGTVVLLDRRGPVDRALLVVLGAWWVSLVLAAFTTRYRVPALPLLGVLAARGLSGTVALARTNRARAAVPVATALVAGVLVLFVLPPRRTPPDHANALLTRGAAWLEAGDPKSAARDLDEASRLREDRDPDALVLLGRACLATRRPIPAWAAFRIALDLDAGRDDAERGLAFAALGLNRPHEAVAALEHALARAPGDPALGSTLAGARHAAERVEDAPLPAGARDDPRRLLR
jgi:tetratricopeptide (TPR) repeat protein